MSFNFNSSKLDDIVTDFIEKRKALIIDGLIKKYKEEIEREFKTIILEEASRCHVYIERNSRMGSDFVIKFEEKPNPKEKK